MADPGEGPGGGRSPPLFSDQTEARRAEKSFLETGSHLISRSGAGTGFSGGARGSLTPSHF